MPEEMKERQRIYLDPWILFRPLQRKIIITNNHRAFFMDQRRSSVLKKLALNSYLKGI